MSQRFFLGFVNKATLFALVLAVQSLWALPATAVSTPLHGLIKGDALWATFKTRFIEKNGRVVDNANKNISHSEGQGFALVMAVASDDPIAFARIWSFAKEKLAIRKDNLFAWKWDPNRLIATRDKNNATDGDILIAWALLEAAEAGFGENYRNEALLILSSVKKLVRYDKFFGSFLMPAAFGFSADHQGGKDIINMSYWVYPAFDRIAQITGNKTWLALSNSGQKILSFASNNKAGLPADWSSLKRHKGQVGQSHKFSSTFSYNAVRVPLYLAWSGTGNANHLVKIQKNWIGRSQSLKQIEVSRNKIKGAFAERGYQAIAATVHCALSGQRFPDALRHKLDKLYYPASLHILSIIATKQRYPQCW